MWCWKQPYLHKIPWSPGSHWCHPFWNWATSGDSCSPQGPVWLYPTGCREKKHVICFLQDNENHPHAHFFCYCNRRQNPATVFIFITSLLLSKLKCNHRMLISKASEFPHQRKCCDSMASISALRSLSIILHFQSKQSGMRRMKIKGRILQKSKFLCVQ